MTQIFLCPPTYYDIKYVINPWMDLNNKVDKNMANVQYLELKDTFRKLDIKFDELSPDPNLPDQVYTTDLGHVEGKNFVRANFKYSERQKEATIAEEYFVNKGFSVKKLPDNIFFEGGDILKFGDKYVLGWGKRTSKEASLEISDLLNVEILPIELTDAYFYHLDTCFAPITNDVALINDRALTKSGIEEIKRLFPTLITTSPEDDVLLACNLLNINGNAVLTQGISKDLKEKLSKFVEVVDTVPMSECLKGGGSVHCISLEIFA